MSLRARRGARARTQKLRESEKTLRESRLKAFVDFFTYVNLPTTKTKIKTVKAEPRKVVASGFLVYSLPSARVRVSSAIRRQLATGVMLMANGVKFSSFGP